jgi:hypothetical protein
VRAQHAVEIETETMGRIVVQREDRSAYDDTMPLP